MNEPDTIDIFNYGGSFPDLIVKVKSFIGKRPLSNDELLALAADAISHTYTHEERDYNQGRTDE